MQDKISLNTMLGECRDMQSYLEVNVSDDINELTERLSTISVFMARSGQLLADAKYLQDTERAGMFAEHSKTILKMPATIAARFIESQTAEINYLVVWIDRINATCKHHCDNLRTLISYSKEQLRVVKSGY